MSRVNRTLTALATFPPLLHLLIYLISIPVFAVIYFGMPQRSFYHSTAQREFSTMTSDARRLLDWLESEMKLSFEEFYGDSTQEIDGWMVDIDELTVSSVYVGDFAEDSTVTLAISVPIWYQVPEGPIMYQHSTQMTFNLGDRVLTRGFVILWPEFSEPARSSLANIPEIPDANSLYFVYKPDSEFLSADATYLPVALYNNLVDFGDAYRGFPGRSAGQFERMLYLSAGIATSSTLGDILPLTTTARLVVTMQSIVAIVLVALFINAVAQRAVDKRGGE